MISNNEYVVELLIAITVYTYSVPMTEDNSQ